MARRRFIQIDGELVEVNPDHVSEPRAAKDTGILWNDRAYQDMGDARFNSRTSHREYMKARGLTTTDDFMGDTWRKSEQRRMEIRQGIDPSRKNDVIESVRKLQAGYRPRPRRD